MLGFKKVFVWHMDRPSRWEQVMEKYELVSHSIKGAHVRFLNKTMGWNNVGSMDKKIRKNS